MWGFSKQKSLGILDGFFGLSSKVNKRIGADQADTDQGVVSNITPLLELSTPDEEIIKLTQQWERDWNDSAVRGEWLEKANENEKYWLGKQFGKAEIDMTRPMVDNMIFESLETFLPQATRRNPEAVVKPEARLENDQGAIDYAKKVQKDLSDLADRIKLRLKVKRATRHWSIYLLGVGKPGWNITTNQPTLQIIRAKKIILDPKATIDEDGYSGKRIGEYRKMEASILVQISEKHKDYITELVKGEMGTEVQFIEWWTPEYTCWTLKDKVLLKKRNLHWNYGTEASNKDTVDEYGQPVQIPIDAVDGVNHFEEPKVPYIFLSIFNLGTQPIDDTSLISQNLSGQDLINKRLKQIDRNADSMNNGMVVSEERSGLTKEQASKVSEALRRGGTVVIPTGDVNAAVGRFSSQALPSDVFNQLMDSRSRLRERFGTTGLTAAGIRGEDTVRGKILTRSVDTDRIGGGVTEYLEQFADDAYNWFIQLYYVYSEEYRTLIDQASQDQVDPASGQTIPAMGLPKLVISVKEGSLLPKDSQSEAQQAVDLASAGLMSLLDLYKKLDDPDPETKAANVWLQANAPQILYSKDPRVQQVMQMQAQAAQTQAQQEAANRAAETTNSNMHKAFDHESKMAQLDAKNKGDILKKVPIK